MGVSKTPQAFPTTSVTLSFYVLFPRFTLSPSVWQIGFSVEPQMLQKAVESLEQVQTHVFVCLSRSQNRQPSKAPAGPTTFQL